MKIERFNKINEKLESIKYWVFVIPATEIFEMEDCNIFEDDRDAFNYLVNSMYNTYKNNNLDLDELDQFVSNCEDDVTCLYETYIDIMRDRSIGEYLLMTYIPISYDIKIKDWIQTRFDAKNYNL